MKFKNCSIKQFQNLSNNKNIICFGAGKFFFEFLEICHIENNIKFIIDNNEKLWDTFINIKNNIINIYSFEKALKLMSKEDILLITAGQKFGIDIYESIKNLDLNINSVYWGLFIMQSKKTRNEFFPPTDIKFKLTDEPQIPKIIHYAWFGKNPIPEQFQEYIAGWKEKCPDFEIVKWDETNYDVSKNKYMKQAYDAKVWGFVPDYARKDIIYEYGGIYLDTDVEVIKNLEDLLYQDGFCGFTNAYIKINNNFNFGLNFGLGFGLGFGAKKHLKIIKNLRDMYDDLKFNPKNKYMETGPMLETKEMKKYGLKTNGSYQQIEGLTIYPSEVLSGTNDITGESYITKNTYTVHHYAATWFEKKQLIKRDTCKDIYKNFTVEYN